MATRPREVEAIEFSRDGVGSYRGVAATAETALEGALGEGGGTCGCVVRAEDERKRERVIGADLDRERALTDGGEHLVGRENL